MSKTKSESKTKDLVAKVNKLSREKEEYIDKWKRALAELENYRKRSEKHIEDTKKFALENILYELLSVVDNFERALLHIENSDSIDTLKTGVEMIYKEIRNLLNRYGVERIDSLGKEYDPNFHEAIEMIDQKHDKEKKSNEHIVVEEILPGYTIHNRLLRPAKVKISDSEKMEEKNAERRKK
jgi:molecular chaperone GrpE